MSHRKTWLASALLVLGCLLFSGLSVSAGEKGKDQPKAGGALLTKDGELTADDEKDTHPELKASPRKVYKVKLLEGKTYQIDLRSNAFDPVLRLENADGKEVAFNDDFEKTSLDSRIVFKTFKTEEYKVIATCLDGQLTGRKNAGKFTLTVVEAATTGAGDATVSIFKGKAIELTVKDGKARYEGEINAEDAVTQNHYFKIFTVKMQAGKSYRIDHMSEDFDAYLFLEDPTGKTLAQDDDGGEKLNSRIIYKASKDGVYRIVPTTLLSRKTGKFVLEFSPASAAEEKEAALNERVFKFADSTPEEQKKTLQEVLKRFQGKGEKLTISDARLAFQLGSSVEDADADLAKTTYADYIKLFSAAENPQVAGVVKAFEGALKKLALLGKTMDITGKTVDGKDFDLKNLKGKVVLVDFWATWCGPCIAELPNMESAYKKYHGKGFDIIGVSLDRTDDAIVKFYETRKLPWPSINIEDSRTLADRYGVNSIPFPVLVDAGGRVVSFRARGPQLERLLEKMLGAKK